MGGNVGGGSASVSGVDRSTEKALNHTNKKDTSMSNGIGEEADGRWSRGKLVGASRRYLAERGGLTRGRKDAERWENARGRREWKTTKKNKKASMSKPVKEG